MKNILVLYNGQSMYTPTVQDYVGAFRKYSRNNVNYLHVGHDTQPQFSLDDFDVLVITYSCRLCYMEMWSPHVRKAVADFRGLKVALPQDEYQETNKLRNGLRELGVGVVLTCVPEDKIAWVYPPELFPGVRFRRVLTGYVPSRLQRIPRHILPRADARNIYIGYRGRSLGHCWGDLAYWKMEIGVRVKRACERRGIPHDIGWTEKDRIYQDKWYSFIASCRTMIGTPSGCNVFDFDGQLERGYKELIKRNPNLTYEEYRPIIAHKESEIDMGQASPRMFEEAALGTAMVLLEGSYSNVVTPGEDCIIVRRDFSNIDDALDQLADPSRVQAVADAAYRNLIESGKWTYENFIAQFDDAIEIDDSDEKISLETTRVIGSKGYDQGFLEGLSLRSTYQYPMSCWLDLSHLRLDVPEQHVIFDEILSARKSPLYRSLGWKRILRGLRRLQRAGIRAVGG
jgi:hypothetical protein